MEPVLHAANALLLLSYAARDILWLRLLTVLGLGVLLAHEAVEPSPSRVPAAWTGAFLALNLLHAAWLGWERRPMRMSADEAALRFLVLDGLTDAQFRALVRLARWEDHPPGSGLLQPGQPVDVLRVLMSGEAAVLVRGVQVHALRPGAFVGELAFLTGEPAAASVVARTHVVAVAWRGPALRRLLDADPNLRAVLQASLGTDVAQKLKAAS